MVLALVWWAILLISKNQQAFDARTALLQIEKETSEDQSSIEEAILKLELTHQRQMYMIIGEGAVFAIALFFGIWFINRGYANEIDISLSKREIFSWRSLMN